MKPFEEEPCEGKNALRKEEKEGDEEKEGENIAKNSNNFVDKLLLGEDEDMREGFITSGNFLKKETDNLLFEDEDDLLCDGDDPFEKAEDCEDVNLN